MDYGPRASAAADFRMLTSALISSLLLVTTAPVLAQRPFPSPRDPLMSLMLSQPQIDIAAAPTATASFDPPVVRPGEKTFYRVVFNALEESIEWPGKIHRPAPTGNPPRRPGRDVPDGRRQPGAADHVQPACPRLQPGHVHRARVCGQG